MKAHIVPNPAGTFSLVGYVPAHPRCVRFLRPTDPGYLNAVRARRTVERNGRTYGWTGRPFPSRESAARALRAAGIPTTIPPEV